MIFRHFLWAFQCWVGLISGKAETDAARFCFYLWMNGPWRYTENCHLEDENFQD
jgi:hypothetical protein